MEKEYTIVNGELYHYGVPGMRWGHRKKYITIYNASKNASKARKEAEKEAADKGLNKSASGRRLTKQYAKAAAKASVANDILANKKAKLESVQTRETPKKAKTLKSKASKGKSFVGGVLAGIGAVGVGAVIVNRKKIQDYVGQKYLEHIGKMLVEELSK